MVTLLVCHECGDVVLGCEIPIKNGVIRKYCFNNCMSIFSKDGCENIDAKETKFSSVRCPSCQKVNDDYDD